MIWLYRIVTPAVLAWWKLRRNGRAANDFKLYRNVGVHARRGVGLKSLAWLQQNPPEAIARRELANPALPFACRLGFLQGWYTNAKS